MTRQDPHSLDNFDPDDYVYVSSMRIQEIPNFESALLIDLGDRTCEILIGDRDKLAQDRKQWIERIDREGFQQGNFINRRTCDHCGAWIKYGECYKHKPSKQLIVVGSNCAENRFGQDHGATDVLAIKKQCQAIEVYGLKAKKIQKILDSNEGLPDAIRYDAHRIVRSIRTSLLTYGKLSDEQIKTVFKAVLGKWTDRSPEEFEAEPKPVEPLDGGKRVCEGTILAIKKVNGNFGDVWKMMLQLDCGNKIWGTIAKQLIDEADIEGVPLKGCKVRFVATVKVQKDHFGFFSRPKEAELIEFVERKKG